LIANKAHLVVVMLVLSDP